MPSNNLDDFVADDGTGGGVNANVAENDFTPDNANVDMGPEARRLQAGLAASPRVHSDDELGLNPGPISGIYVNPTLAKVFPSVAADFNKMPANAAEGIERDKLRNVIDAHVGLNEAQRGIGALALGGPLAGAGVAMGRAAGLGPGLARLVGGGVAGGVTAPLASGKLGDAPAGAAAGAVATGLSNLMSFIVGRVAVPATAKALARAGGKTAQAIPQDEIISVIKKYDIGNIKRPAVAKDAIEASIVRAESVKKAAMETIGKAGGLTGKGVGAWSESDADLAFAKRLKMSVEDYRKVMAKRTAESAAKATNANVSTELVKQAENTLAKTDRELAVLKAIQPAANKLAVAASLRPTMMERVSNGASRVARTAVAGAGAGAAWKLLSGGNNGK